MSNLFAPQYVQGVYIPSALLLVGTAIIKKEWLPFAAILAAALGGWKVYSNGTRLILWYLCHPSDCSSSPQGTQAHRVSGV